MVSSSWHVRRVHAADLPAIADIVNEHIRDGVAHFDERPMAVSEWVTEWRASQERFPWLTADRRGEIAGLAYGKPFNPRAAYDWTAEVSIYLRTDPAGQGIGRALYARLLPLLDAQGYRCLIAGVTLPNDASVALHESFGFRFLGTLERVGYKHGTWWDVGSWQRLNGAVEDEPEPIRSVSEVEDGA